MATIDRHAGRGEKLRIARGLELIGNQNHKQRLERWQKAFDSDKPPEWVDPDENQDGTQRETLEDARRDYLQSIFEIVEKLPRREIARRLLTSTKAPLLDQLKQTGRVELFAFAGQAESVEVDQLSKIIADPPASLLTDSSDLSLGLNWGTGHAGELAGIILLTVGRFTRS
jgi:hypothetical protein